MIKIKASDQKVHSLADVAVKVNGKLYYGLRMVIKKDGVLHTVWEKIREIIETTFLDRFGRPFYSRDGIPFQGRK